MCVNGDWVGRQTVSYICNFTDRDISSISSSYVWVNWHQQFNEYLRNWDHAEVMYIKKDCSKYWFLLHIQKPSKLWWDGWKIDDYLFYFIRYSIVELVLILIRTLCTYLKLHLGNHQRSSNMIYRNVNHCIFYFKQYFGIAYFFSWILVISTKVDMYWVF